MERDIQEVIFELENTKRELEYAKELNVKYLTFIKNFSEQKF